jgi:hypothetical protein
MVQFPALALCGIDFSQIESMKLDDSASANASAFGNPPVPVNFAGFLPNAAAQNMKARDDAHFHASVKREGLALQPLFANFKKTRPPNQPLMAQNTFRDRDSARPGQLIFPNWGKSGESARSALVPGAVASP